MLLSLTAALHVTRTDLGVESMWTDGFWWGAASGITGEVGTAVLVEARYADSTGRLGWPGDSVPSTGGHVRLRLTAPLAVRVDQGNPMNQTEHADGS